MRFHPDRLAESKSGGWNPKQWASLIPCGVNQQHPNAYQDIVKAIWENRDQLGYAWRILRDGCCDGCGLGTNGLRDWTMKGVHLCNIRLQLLRFNTAPEIDYRLLEDAAALKDLRLDTSGTPDYSATVEVVRSADLAKPTSGREVRGRAAD